MNATEPSLTTEWSLDFLKACRFWIPNILVPIIFVVGLIGNGTTIIVLTRKRMTGSTNIYLTALAFADLLFLIFYLSVALEHHLKHIDYMLYWEYWRFGVWLMDATGGISTWLTVSFTLERYIAVCHPLKGKVLCTESRAKKVIAIVVIFCLLTTITTPFEWKAEMVLDPNTNDTSFVNYSPLGRNETYKVIFYWYTSIMFVFVPLILLGSLNYLLISAVRLSQQRRKKLTQMASSRKVYREKQENKITLALVAVVFLFLLCQVPTALTLILKIFYDPEPETVGDNILRAAGNILNFLVAVYTACNFLLYCAMSDKYRQTMYRTFCPTFAYKHERASTFSSNASYRNSSIHG